MISQAAAMNAREFRQYGIRMIDFVGNYWNTLRNRTPLPDVQPGYMRKLIPEDPPVEGESWDKIFNDIDKVVIDGNTHWQHPNFYAFFPTACSYQSIIGDILSGAIGSIGFSWKSSPSMTELEISVVDWLAKAFALPADFLNRENGCGVGIIQNSASDASFMAILAARGRAVERMQKRKLSMEKKDIKILNGEMDIGEVFEYPYHDASCMSKLIAYCSDQAHSSIEKGVMLAGVRLRKLKTVRGGPSDNFYVPPNVLQSAIEVDRRNGLVPFIYVMTLGTTSTGSVESVEELGAICQRENIWVHIDSAYAGVFMICPEHRYLSRGFEYVNSFNTNVHKALLMNFDCSPMWFRDKNEVEKYFEVNPIYLKHDHTSAVDYRHLQVALGRRFRSLKIWFVMRNIGLSGLRNHLRKMIDLAKYFEELIREDSLLELFVPRTLGLVCFRLKNSTNEMNLSLCNKIVKDRRIFLVSSAVHGVFFLRLTICSPLTTRQDIIQTHSIIHKFAEEVVKEYEKYEAEGSLTNSE